MGGAEELCPLARARTPEQAMEIVDDDVFGGRERLVLGSPAGTVILTPRDFEHPLRKFGDHREVIASAVVPTIVRPSESWKQVIVGGKDLIHHIKAFRRNGDNAVIVCVFRENQDGSNFVTFYEMWEGRRGIDYVNAIRQGVLLHEG